MNEVYDNGNETVKSEEQLLQGLLEEKQVYENENDRENNKNRRYSNKLQNKIAINRYLCSII